MVSRELGKTERLPIGYQLPFGVMRAFWTQIEASVLEATELYILTW